MKDKDIRAERVGDMWRAVVDGRGDVHAETAEAAIYWAGWWAGREALLKAMEVHVAGGGEADEVCCRGRDERGEDAS